MVVSLRQVRAAETAFAQRDTQFFVDLLGVTPWPDEFPGLRENIRRLHAQMLPAALPGRLPNFSDQDDSDPIRRYDPAGILHRS